MQLFKKCVECIADELKLKNFWFQHDQVDQFYRAQWQRDERSLIYLIYRWIWALFFIGVFVACLVLQFSDGKYFIFLTNWGIILCTMTQCAAAILVTCWHYNLLEVRAKIHEFGTKITIKTPKFVKFYWLLHGVTLSLSFVITTIYWIFLHGKMNKPVTYPMISFVTHCLNSVFMLVDFLIVAFPVRFLHTIYAMLLPIIYCGFTIVYFWCGGEDEYGNPYIYPLLDWRTPTRGIITFIGVFCLYLIYAIIIYLVFKLKRLLCNTLNLVWTPKTAGLI